MENKIGRLLSRQEEVHHVDGNKHNNSPKNLEIKMKGEHQRFHSTKYPNGHFIDIICKNCGVTLKRKYNQRAKVKNNKNYFCSKRCNGLFNGF